MEHLHLFYFLVLLFHFYTISGLFFYLFVVLCGMAGRARRRLFISSSRRPNRPITMITLSIIPLHYYCLYTSFFLLLHWNGICACEYVCFIFVEKLFLHLYFIIYSQTYSLDENERVCIYNVYLSAYNVKLDGV